MHTDGELDELRKVTTCVHQLLFRRMRRFMHGCGGRALLLSVQGDGTPLVCKTRRRAQHGNFVVDSRGSAGEEYFVANVFAGTVEATCSISSV